MHSFHALTGLVLSLLYLTAEAQFQPFLTQPTFQAPVINIATDRNPSLQSTGYFFLAPYITAGHSYGPQIFDTFGNLIWYGNETVIHRAMDFQVCTYQGRTVLCYNDGVPFDAVGGHSIGVNRFFDNTYTEIPNSTVGALNGLVGPDTHELNTPPGQGGVAVLQTVYETRPMDLSAYGGPSNGYILDGCFQEVSLFTKTVNFQWCSLDHVSPADSYVAMTQTGLPSNNIGGNGSLALPWDYFHINAVAREVNGDYAVSSRHTNTIYKVCGASGQNGPPGSIQWYLGGKRNQFAKTFNFSSQHMVRFHGTGNAVTHLTLFDNASDGVTRTADVSAGMYIQLNNSTMQASLVASYPNPDGHLAISQGGVQILPNGNAAVGWGYLPAFSEFTSGGSLLYHARFAVPGMQSYRAFRFDWIGKPTTNPDLLVYAQNCSAPLQAYVSWNGATQVVLWRFRVAQQRTGGSWTGMTTVVKDGFETSAQIAGGFAPWVFVEAIDRYNNVIGQSAPTKTFVPLSSLGCGALNCSAKIDYSLASNSKAGQC